jgi:hypothetical protein
MKKEFDAPESVGEGLELGLLVRGREYSRKVRDLLWKIRAEQESGSPGPCRPLFWKALHAAARAEDLFARAGDQLPSWNSPGTRMRAGVLKMECIELLEQALILEREVRDNATSWKAASGARRNGSFEAASAA